MPLKYNPAASTTPAAAPPAASPAAAPAVAKNETTRQQLFNEDGSPKPIRNLSALRTQLAGTGGVNPPEATIAANVLEPQTRETADGGAEPIASSQTPAAGTTGPALTKGQRAAATRAANKAAASAASAAPATPTTSQPAGAAELSSVDWPTFFEKVATHELLAELFRRFR